MGEEGDDAPGTTGLRWVVDPLDGTINYLFGIPQWCVSVACEGQVGVVLDPVRDELFTVRAGEPPTLDGVPLAPLGDATTSATALVATGFGYDAGVRAAQGEVVARLLPQVRDIRRARLGGARPRLDRRRALRRLLRARRERVGRRGGADALRRASASRSATCPRGAGARPGSSSRRAALVDELEAIVTG